MKRLLGAFFLSQALAAGSVLFSVLPPVLQTTPPGGIFNVNCVNGSLMCLVFSGSITPDPSNDTYVNAIQISFTPSTASLLSNDNFFFSNVPGFLASIDPIYTGFVFEIDVAPNALTQVYQGTATLLGGINGPGDLAPLVSSTFTVVVAAPEPTAGWLLALGLAAIAAISRFCSTRWPHHIVTHPRRVGMPDAVTLLADQRGVNHPGDRRSERALVP